jgi:hypothetical protein
MPALGQKRRQWAVRRGGSGISQCESNVRFIPNAEDVRYGMRRTCPLSIGKDLIYFGNGFPVNSSVQSSSDCGSSLMA